MRASGTRDERVRRIQRDQSVSSATQRPVVREPLIGYALEIDGVAPLAERLTTAAGILHLSGGFLHICGENPEMRWRRSEYWE